MLMIQYKNIFAVQRGGGGVVQSGDKRNKQHSFPNNSGSGRPCAGGQLIADVGDPALSTELADFAPCLLPGTEE